MLVDLLDELGVPGLAVLLRDGLATRAGQPLAEAFAVAAVQHLGDRASG